MKRQQCLDGPAMLRDASGHRRCGPATAGGQTRMWRAKMIDRPDERHAMVQRQCAARQRPATARQRRQAFPKRRGEPVTVDRRIALSTSASKPRVRVSTHAAPP